jgi:hypothetical protein
MPTEVLKFVKCKPEQLLIHFSPGLIFSHFGDPARTRSYEAFFTVLSVNVT